ncbi:MAG: hypothetical protein ACD_15C00027G0001 [uncultured bacterium]|nr:MAG: hypothetical protein ACD_15C00027G0001 [uncultured bacterium]
MLEDLNADSVEEGDRKFLELTRKLWTELAVHENPDQDARTCLGLLELAGIDTSQYKTAPQKKMREMIKSGLAMDFGDEHGVVAEEGGKLIVIDHHGKKSDRTTSASRFVYEMLVEMGLMQREEYLDKFIEFTTVCDNMRFSPEEMERVYQNYSKNLYGLAYRMKPDDVLELFKNGADPMADLPEDYLKSHQYYNLASKSEESLFDLSNQMENKMKKGEMELDRLEKVKNDQERTPENIRKNDFVVDTGEDRFGKIFIDTRKNAGKDKYFNRIDGANHSEQLAVFRRGYGGYLVWSPEQDSFVLFTKRKMDEEFLPGGLSQGFNMRGHMWMKPRDKEGEPKVKLTVTLEEIFSKLSGKDDFEGKEKLKKIIAIDAGAKEILKLMYEKTLTEGEIRRIAKKVGVRSSGDMIKNIASQLATNKKYKKIDEIFRDKKRLIASTDRSNPKEIERILIETLLEYQENSKVAK